MPALHIIRDFQTHRASTARRDGFMQPAVKDGRGVHSEWIGLFFLVESFDDVPTRFFIEFKFHKVSGGGLFEQAVK